MPDLVATLTVERSDVSDNEVKGTARGCDLADRQGWPARRYRERLARRPTSILNV